MRTITESAQPLLSMTGISKSFGATRALDDVALSVDAGQVLALIGENGAGKSTLMKVLSGAHRPDTGSMRLAGEPFQPTRPGDARRAGVAMIYQELNLAADLTVEENILLGIEQHRLGFVRQQEHRRRVREALAVLGHENLSLDMPVGRLSVGAQQVVEIARGLVSNARVMIFDEPTSSLSRHDVERLFEILQRLKQQGLAVIYISHFLEEVRRVADRYVVMRDGKSVANGPLSQPTDQQLVELMIGRSVENLFPHVPHQIGEPVLEVRSLSGTRTPKSVDFVLRRGEIMGLFGLIGAGRTETLRCLLGLDRSAAGQVMICSEDPERVTSLTRSVEVRATNNAPAVTSPPPEASLNAGFDLPQAKLGGGDQPSGQRKTKLSGGPRRRLNAGLGLVSEDRKTEGLAQSMSIADNLTLSALHRYSMGGLLRLGPRRQAVRHWMQRLSVKAQGPEQTIGQLSGAINRRLPSRVCCIKMRRSCCWMSPRAASMSVPKRTSIA